MARIVHYYRKTKPGQALLETVKEELHSAGFQNESTLIEHVETENCYNVKIDNELSTEQTQQLEWLLSETFERDQFSNIKSFFDAENNNEKNDVHYVILEFGPRMTFSSAFSSNAVSICQSCHLSISRLELSRRYRFKTRGSLSQSVLSKLKSILHDKMTEEEYVQTLTSFDSGNKVVPTKTIPIMERGRVALEELNQSMGLGFDDFDLDYYTKIFKVGLSQSEILALIVSTQLKYLHYLLFLVF